jgi:hypothetical protein
LNAGGVGIRQRHEPRRTPDVPNAHYYAREQARRKAAGLPYKQPRKFRTPEERKKFRRKATLAELPEFEGLGPDDEALIRRNIEMIRLEKLAAARAANPPIAKVPTLQPKTLHVGWFIYGRKKSHAFAGSS